MARLLSDGRPAQFVSDVAWLYSMSDGGEGGDWRQLDAPWQPREDVAMATDIEVWAVNHC
jgi:hypothetical protein